MTIENSLYNTKIIDQTPGGTAELFPGSKAVVISTTANHVNLCTIKLWGEGQKKDPNPIIVSIARTDPMRILLNKKIRKLTIVYPAIAATMTVLWSDSLKDYPQ